MTRRASSKHARLSHPNVEATGALVRVSRWAHAARSFAGGQRGALAGPAFMRLALARGRVVERQWAVREPLCRRAARARGPLAARPVDAGGVARLGSRCALIGGQVDR